MTTCRFISCSMLFALSACSGSVSPLVSPIDNAPPDAHVVRSATHDDASDDAPPPRSIDAEATVPDASDAAMVDASPTSDACVPLTRAEACASKNCGFVSDGCSSGYSCEGDAGPCPLGQGCGVLASNVCGGCVRADANLPGCASSIVFVDCPIVDGDGGPHPYVPPDCVYNDVRNVACCT